MSHSVVTPEMAAQAMAPATNRAAQAIYLDFHHNHLAFESYLATTSAATHSQFNAIKLTNDAQLCPRHIAHLQSPASQPPCPLGNRCPFRHETPSSLNFGGAASNGAHTSHGYRDQGKRTVCKHWLRGLCKKGDSCDYLHEYDLRRMPECRFFATFGYCNSGDECLYLHVDTKAKIRECEDYKRGFCRDGPKCEKKHVRRPACPLYMAGFCPNGPSCRLGHIKSTFPSPASRSNSPVQTHRPLTAEEAFGGRDRGGDRGDTNRPRYGGGGGGGGRYDGGESYGVGRPQYQRNAADTEGDGNRPKKDLNQVTCYKCGDRGHFANACPNPNRPGNRGGTERGSGGRERGNGRPY
ncbi:hypothetical protein CBS101457_001163 [Exobasidium rhododendri]|nr:hypothetical protein CBS101457_001163 [Exobasidium rhododendri]